MALPETSPFEDLAAALAATSFLAGVKVRAHPEKLASNDRSRRIVLVPVSGEYESGNARDVVRETITTVEARIWGSRNGDVWDLHGRFLEALDAVAIGDPSSDDDVGPFFQLIGYVFPSGSPAADTAKDGAALVVTFTLNISLLRVELTRGRVDSYSLEPAPPDDDD